MTVEKEVYVDLSEKYNKVLKLLEDSKSDPPHEPYKSKYSAKDILTTMMIDLESQLTNSLNSAETLKLTAMLGTVYLYLGMVSIETEEFPPAETYLQKCYDKIKDYEDRSEVVMLTLNMYNHFGILWSDKDPQKSKTYLEKAEMLYFKFKKTCNTPLDVSQLFEEEKQVDSVKNLEKAHTLTLYYLAQIYGALKDALKSSVYCHVTLQRQLVGGDYEPIDWALNSATLSQFFMEQNGFKQARHHLSASSFILDQYEKKLGEMNSESEEFYAKVEEFKHRSADIARCWAKYGILLLARSKERLLNHTDDIDKVCAMASDLRNLTLTSDSVTKEELQNLEFKTLDLTEYERQISDKFALTIQDARFIFLNIQTWLQKAESYYTLENLASDHVEIVQDKSQMYLHLLFFEDNSENQAKLHKRRIDLLENVTNKINPQFYLQYCRQLWFELAQTYLDILNIKLDKLKEAQDRPSPHNLKKINHLTERSIYNFNSFVKSFKEVEEKKRVPEDFEKAFLQGYFHIGALFGKYITLDKKTQLANTEASFGAYKCVLDYCDLHEEAKEAILMEHSICKEMVSLLPVKIAKLKQEAS